MSPQGKECTSSPSAAPFTTPPSSASPDGVTWFCVNAQCLMMCAPRNIVPPDVDRRVTSPYPQRREVVPELSGGTPMRYWPSRRRASRSDQTGALIRRQSSLAANATSTRRVPSNLPCPRMLGWAAPRPKRDGSGLPVHQR